MEQIFCTIMEKLKKSISLVVVGASLRVVSKEETIFAHTNEPTFENLMDLAKTLKKNSLRKIR